MSYARTMKHFLMIGLLLGTLLVARAENRERFKEFEKAMTGVKLVGHFTVDGKNGQSKEEYTIQTVKKLPQGDLWMFTARVKYGGTNLVVPMPLPVKWAGNTPVISMKNLKIPLLGTFSAQVVLDGNRYAGTWQHGKVGGHMYGQIVKVKKWN